MLTFQDVSKSFQGPDGAVQALKDVSLTIEAGQFIAVRGPSGSGKSTLLLMAGALMRPTTGTVTLDQTDMYGLSNAARGQLRAKQIGFVFQQFHLLPYLSILDNVLTPSLAVPDPQAPDRARTLIAKFGLEHRLNHTPSQLSTGEKQRAALARALLNGPKLLLADEPTGNLDEANGQTVLEHLAEFAREGGVVLMVTHDRVATDLSDRTIELENGTLR